MRKRKGFTLIELLTVIAIIGILATALVPAVKKVQELARRTSALSKIRNIGSAIKVATDNGSKQIRDQAFSRYFRDPEYLALIETRFGPEARTHIEGMTAIRLKRHILGD